MYFSRVEKTSLVKTICVVIQDYRTLCVLEIREVESSIIDKIEINKKFSLSKSENDKYYCKNIFYNKLKTKVLITVKQNKDSEFYTLLTEFQTENHNPYAYLRKLEQRIVKILDKDITETHIHAIHRKGTKQIAKKLGEEAVELVIEAGKANEEKFVDEAADVFFYLLMLIHNRGLTLEPILNQLKNQKRIE